MDWVIIKEFIRPELLVLVVVLYLIGVALKTSKRIRDNYIPIVLGVIGILLALLYLAAVSDLGTPQAITAYLFAGITQGILAAGGSVYANQIYKQAMKSD